jgi:hypothetical protein
MSIFLQCVKKYKTEHKIQYIRIFSDQYARNTKNKNKYEAKLSNHYHIIKALDPTLQLYSGLLVTLM